MSSSENKSDKKLEAFLKENRPLYPRHSERDGEKIWARLSAETKGLKPARAWGLRPQVFGGAFAALAVLTLVTLLRPSTPINSVGVVEKPGSTALVQTPQQVPAQKEVRESAAAMTSADLIEDSLELGFLENEEMYEVTDLISLGK